MVQECCDQIRSSARKNGFDEREIYHIDTHFDWNQLLASANSLSLFSERKIIEVRMPSGKPGDKGAKALIEYVQSPAPDCLLLIITDKLDSATQKSKWFKAIEGAGQHIQVWPIPESQLPRWLSVRLQADSDAIELLCSRVEGNLLAAAQEIEKLKLIATNNQISYQLMASVVADSARYDVFGLVDRALQGDARNSVKTLQGLRLEGTEPINILWALAKEIRTLVQVSELLSTGKSFDDALMSTGVWDKRKPLVRSALGRLKPLQLQHLLRKTNGIDRAIKGMRDAEPWNEIIDLVLNISGVQSLNRKNELLTLHIRFCKRKHWIFWR